MNLCQTGGGKFVKVGGNNNFCEIGGKCTETAKIGEIRNLCSMTKKGHQQCWRKIFREKVRFLQFFRKSENVSEIGGNSETGGKCIMVSEGMDAPGCNNNNNYIPLHTLFLEC